MCLYKKYAAKPRKIISGLAAFFIFPKSLWFLIIFALYQIEYDIHIALDNIYIDEHNEYVVEMPKSVVLVLREGIKFDKMLNVILRIPKYGKFEMPYEEVRYTVPVCNVSTYNIDDICEKNLLFLMPYYIIRFEERLSQIDSDADKLNELKAEYQELYEELVELSEKEEIARDYVYDIISLTEKIIEYVAGDMENVKREVKQMGGNVLKLDREILIEEAETRGETRGEARNMQLIVKMLEDACDKEDIKRISSDKAYRDEMYKKYGIDL